MNMNVQNDNNVMTQHPDYKTEIADILHSNLTPKTMREQLLSYHEYDIATALDILTADERKKLYRIVDTETLANILEYSEELNKYISELSVRKKTDILSMFEITTTVEVLNGMEKNERVMLIDLLGDDIRREIIMLSAFDEDEIGSKMSTNYISIKSGIGVREAMRELVSQAAENDNITTIYVVDEENTLVGAIDLKNLIIARENTPIENIIMTSYPYVYTTELVDECIERLKEYSEDSIPVLDADNKLRGVLTSQTITQLTDEIFGDDYAKLAGLSAEEDLNEPLKKSVGKRLPWLIILFGLGLLVSGVVGIFEQVVAQLAVIVSFQSLILGMSGNVGTQSLAVTIRVLMDEEVSRRQKFSLIGKEARVGLVNGLILGVMSFLLIGGYLCVFKEQSVFYAFTISACTGIALLISIFLSSLTGTIVPLVFKKMKIDPAIASGPLITTINDLVAVVSYYGLAWVLLIKLL